MPIVTLNAAEGHESVEGVFVGRRMVGEITDELTGEVRERFSVILQKPDSEEKFQIWENAGLRTAIQQADLKEGDEVKIVHLGKVPLKKRPGQTVNQYDIFTR